MPILEVDQRVGADANLSGEVVVGQGGAGPDVPDQSRHVISVGVRFLTQELDDRRNAAGLGFHPTQFPVPQCIIRNAQLGCGPFLRPSQFQAALPEVVSVIFQLFGKWVTGWNRGG